MSDLENGLLGIAFWFGLLIIFKYMFSVHPKRQGKHTV